MTTFSAKLVFESKTTTAWGATVPAAGRLVVELDDGDGVTPVGLYYGNGVDTVAGLDNVLDQQSSATIAALAAKAPLASPTFTGTVTVPTGAVAGAAVNKAQLDALSGTYGRYAVAPSKGCIAFCQDDGPASSVTMANAIAARGGRGTFAITSGLLGTGGYLTSAQVTSIYQQGHEIAAHGATHVDVTALSAAGRLTQYGVQSTLETLTAPGAVKTWIYPLSARNSTTDKELYLRFDRIATKEIFGAGSVYPTHDQFGHRFLLGRVDWDGTAAKQAHVLSLIRKAASTPIAATIYTHDLDAPGSATTAQFTEAIDLCQSLGVPMLTMADAFPSAPLLIDPGFEDAALGSWVPVVSGNTGGISSVADTPDTNMPGARSIRVNCDNAAGFTYAYQAVAIPGGYRNYTLSGRYRVNITSGAGSIRARVSESDAVGSSGTSTDSAALTSTTWATFSVNVTPSSAMSSVTVRLLVNGVVGEAWFDHLHLAPTGHGSFG